MTPADITGIRAPVQVTGTPAASSPANIAQETLGNLTQNAVGKLFQAQVLAQLEDGTFLVSVADSTLRMALPSGTGVSDTLEMTLLASDPRPAFLLEQQSGGTSAALSSAAKLIDAILQTAQQAGGSAAVAGKAPLAASPAQAAATPQLAAALQDSVEFSGVFYESHVSQWVSGERSLADLLREPQAQAQPDPAEAAAGKTPVGSNAIVLPRPPVTDSELSALINNARNASGSSPSPAQNANAANARLLNRSSGAAISAQSSGRNLPLEADTVVRSTVITKENAQTVNAQLNVLEQHRIAWRGELWPGQPIEWEISQEENAHNQGGGTGSDEDKASWQSVVRFDLPNLGKVSASIHLAGGHVQIQVSTASAGSAAMLKAHGDDLSKALGAAGSPLDALIIKQGDIKQDGHV